VRSTEFDSRQLQGVLGNAGDRKIELVGVDRSLCGRSRRIAGRSKSIGDDAEVFVWTARKLLSYDRIYGAFVGQGFVHFARHRISNN
jgi:hypothetical protein